MRTPDTTNAKPVIGLSLSFHDFGDYSGLGPPRPIALAGGVPFVLSRVEEALEDQLDLCDGIMLGAGRDLDPRRYGQEPHELLGPTEPLRDAFELELVAGALERGLPILGTCRGIQLLNVALGGTLVQDLSLRPEWRHHPSDPGWVHWKRVEQASVKGEPDVPFHPRHAIAVAPDSRLAEALGGTEAEVGSHHHQAIDRLGDGLRAVATAPDGVVEAVELEGDVWGLAAQWELHEEWRSDERFLRVFEDFVDVARRGRRGAPGGRLRSTPLPSTVNPR
jgi:putative glutamine amidotransferase